MANAPVALQRSSLRLPVSDFTHLPRSGETETVNSFAGEVPQRELRQVVSKDEQAAREFREWHHDCALRRRQCLHEHSPDRLGRRLQNRYRCIRAGPDRASGGVRQRLAFVNVVIEDHNDAQARAFEEAVGSLPEIVACWSIAGSTDFLLQIVAPDLDTYAALAMTMIRRMPGIKAMHTMLTLKEVKAPAPWPIPTHNRLKG